MSTNALESIVADCVEALERVGDLFSSDAAGQALLSRLGWQVAVLPPSLSTLGGQLRELRQLITEARARPESPELWVDLARTVAGLVTDIRSLENQSFGTDLDAISFGSRLGEQLLQWAAIEQLDRRHPRLLAILRAVGLVRSIQHAATDAKPAYIEARLITPDFATLLTSPSALLRAAWAWGDPAFDGSGLLDELIGVFRMFGVPTGFVPFPPSTRELADVGPGALRWHVVARVLSGTSNGAAYEAGLRLLTLGEGVEPVIALLPYVEGSLTEAVEFGDGFQLTIAGAASAGDGRGLLFAPSGVRLVNHLFGAADAAPAGEISATLQRRQAEPVETAIGPFAVQSAGWLVRAAARAADGLDGELVIEATFTDAHIGLPVADDGFLSSLLGSDPVMIPVPVVFGISSKRGVYIGPTGLTKDVAVSVQLGPVEVRRLTLAIDAVDHGLRASVGTLLMAGIGPVSLAVDGFGASIRVEFPGSGGNLGPIALSADLVPPTGVGVAVDAPSVSGGGSLSFDPHTESYSGMLELQIEDTISVKAIGLLTTRMPDGSKGYSLVLIIFVEGFTPIQLGFGFVLTGIGGLLAINRTFDEDALRAGLKDHALDSVMFPEDPIRNAPQIISSLNRVFPPATGHHLFGPMAQIAWGTPALITADVGVVLEFGARLRLLILAQIVAVLPNRQNDLLRLQMDAVGIIDFDQSTASLDATLHDSRLLQKFVLTGDMAMRLKWDSSPNFALAVGGLHPAFNPPPNFPKLERIAINFATGNNPRFRAEAYFALTSNTVQFGARAELFAAAAGFSIQGETGYDVLIQLDPFHFVADYYAQLQLKHGSTNLFKVRVEGSLAGPRPLHINGKATFEVLWWDVSIRFDATLVEGELPPPPEPVDVLPRLKEALGNPANWAGRLPDGQRPIVTLGVTQSAPTDVFLHPLGALTVKQSIVPLNMAISRFGQAAPAGANLFTIGSVSLGGQSQTTHSVNDFFAPAQFFELSDEEKLSRPSFEPMAAGVSFGANEFTFTDDDSDRLEVNAIQFETIIVDKETHGSRPSGSPDLYQLSSELLGKQAVFGAAGNCDLRRTGKARYRTTRDKYRVVHEDWSIVATDDLTPQPVPGGDAGQPVTYSQAARALATLQREQPAKANSFHILRLSELRVATPVN